MKPDAIHSGPVDDGRAQPQAGRDTTHMDPFSMSYDTSDWELDLDTATNALALLTFINHIADNG
jgi:hypothetical protein